MPQFEPFTLNLQWNSTLIIIIVTVTILGKYALPQIQKTLMARRRLITK